VVGLKAKSVVQFVIPCFGIFFSFWFGWDGSFVPFFFCYKFLSIGVVANTDVHPLLSPAQIGWRHFIPLFPLPSFFFCNFF
jgi:hypothetical protein